ncbi:sigma-70 family RNA polymerase sigma factor [Azospirillum sp. SYSU D00513]|uniref:RNA polymerase sigma factor n=1 Tax=Azospirillum sp. SYSU D00513 TaxID=2812561 RepID=UPI001A96A42A|nr:sigma-70 family RNA polymerase sigma factor [Azospirillum sp. SYSU D00513]
MLVAIGGRRDRTAFASLYSRVAPRLKAYFLQWTDDSDFAEELARKVMLVVWHQANVFDASSIAASTWIFAIARDKMIEAVRHQRRLVLDPDDSALFNIPEQAIAAGMPADPARSELTTALNSLLPGQEKILRLAYFEGKDQQGIAEALAIDSSAVDWRLRAALDSLRNALRNAA